MSSDERYLRALTEDVDDVHAPTDYPHRQVLDPQAVEVSVAITTTRHFDFLATGATSEEARAALLAAWARHAEQTGADPEYLTAEDINVVTGPIGQAFRDGRPI